MPLVRSEIACANLKLGDLELSASRFSVGGPKPLSAQIDSNSFNLGNLGKMLPPVAGYDLRGMSEIHGSATLDNSGPIFRSDGIAETGWFELGAGLAECNYRFERDDPLDPGTRNNRAEQLSIGSARANFEGQIDSVSPLNASYVLKADSLKLGELFLSSAGSGTINQLVVNGTADGELASSRFSARILSSDRSLGHASYRNLDVTAAYKDNRAAARPFMIDAFGGSLEADADAVLGATTSFNATLKMRNLNVQQALRSQNIDAADTVHGFLTGNVAASGSGSGWDRIKPTLHGSGRLVLAIGKLVGVNIVADAINALASAPGISPIMNVAFMSSHHGLLMDPDTALQAASMSFQLAGPRFTTHDLFARSPDYQITGMDGSTWTRTSTRKPTYNSRSD